MHSSINISVIIPLFNNRKFIKEAICSALRQPEVGEVIVVDDNSSDGSYNAVSKLSDSRLKLYKLPRNQGVAYARNYGVMKSSKEYIAFLDSDDIFLDGRFKGDIEQLKKFKADGIYNATGSINESIQGGSLDSLLTTLDQHYPPLNLHKALLGTIKRKGHFSLIATTFHKSVFEQIKFNPDITYGEDTLLCILASIHFTLIPGEIKKPRSRRRLHVNQSTKRNSKRFFSDRVKIFNFIQTDRLTMDKLAKKERDAVKAYYHFYQFVTLPPYKKLIWILTKTLEKPNLYRNPKLVRLIVKNLLTGNRN